MKTSIIILTYNKLEYTKQCIESIRKYTHENAYEIIVVDNASQDDTAEWLAQQTDVVTILNKENRGFPEGCNQGIEVATGTEILLLNNDTIVTQHWLSNLLKALYSSDEIGAVGCVTNNSSYFQEIDVPYGNIDDMHSFAKDYNISNPLSWEERLKLVGFCMLIKKSVIEQIGLLDERFSPGNYEDDDYSIRMRKNGYKLLLCKDTFIHHYGSTSFKEDKSYFNSLLEKNAKKFEEKWGFDPIYSQHKRDILINLIEADASSQITVLEVGCACGGTLLGIKNKFKNSLLYGIELNENSASIASLVADVIPHNVENGDLPYPPKSFDYIIFGDVLEHLYDPWKTLGNMRQFLKPDGKILASIPNIMHYSVINELLDGKWKYADAGILDRTHVRFFTLASIQEMFINSGFVNLDFMGVNLPRDSTAVKGLERLSKVVPNEILNQFEVYQYIISACNNQLLDIMNDIKNGHINKQEIFEVTSSQTNDEILRNVKFLSCVADKVEVLNTIGVIHFEQGEIAKVLPLFDEALSLDETHLEVIYNIAYFLHHIGEEELSEEYMLRLKSLDFNWYQKLMEVLV
ncbi:GT2 family glycosyltransferase [Paenibacillus jamilae]|jgi:GT2 family glycosyltransferase|uniref:glycosyltransferase n=1 Tax=Paenibacillus TaxID=44249 RepID=UPI000D31F963|nr:MULTISPECIES: glycosyltransferase [Paenibacillus]MDP9677298.1 GT2 family glycosyltransferase [Paenibacillus jamilae]KAF6621129.1 glycosyltransferase [Paenibacillus sp. EKM101P]KAF6622433.1 glycosyltransferase [Paenibacillus sp. EKM102P]KAF6632282.1 glycosyltransferase [Paenibacillus sp. EKM10P]KAF6647037.1 glycosyltransferase [Paenibacillus sp. EKM11P]